MYVTLNEKDRNGITKKLVGPSPQPSRWLSLHRYADNILVSILNVVDSFFMKEIQSSMVESK